MTNALLIQAIVQQTMVFVAQLATLGRDRVPLAHVSDQVFLALTEELRSHGVRQKVIADMFGMALRTYHRRIKALNESGTVPGQTLWAAVLDHIQVKQPVSVAALQVRFSYDDPGILTGVLNELTDAGCVYRSGRGRSAVYRVADQADFAEDEGRQAEATAYLVWLTIYRNGPVAPVELSRQVRLPQADCDRAVQELLKRGVVRSAEQGLVSDSFVVEVGDSSGWEAAVLDHYQALVNAVMCKLCASEMSEAQRGAIGGTTYSFDIPVGHPMEGQVMGQLERLRVELDALRDSVDAVNAQSREDNVSPRQVIFYAGQYIKE